MEVTDVTSSDLRCYDSATNPTASTISVAAGSQLGIMSDGTIYHQGVSTYMRKQHFLTTYFVDLGSQCLHGQSSQ